MDPTQDKWTSKFSKKADAYLTSEVDLGRERQMKEIGNGFLQLRLNVLKNQDSGHGDRISNS